MLTYQDCLELSGFTEDEIEAIAEHEHVPEIIAVELANYLAESDSDGMPRIRKIIIEDIEHARVRGHSERVTHLEGVLRHFIATHPLHRE
jgi:hypothetical protein